MAYTGKLEEEEEDHESMSRLFHVVQTKASIVDPTQERVFCPYCRSLMRYLPGFPQGHAQWLCTSCAQTAYEAYGDRPSYDTDYKSLSAPNNPYQDQSNTTAFVIKDIPTDLDEEERQQHYEELMDKMKRRRYTQFTYLSAQEATRKI